MTVSLEVRTGVMLMSMQISYVATGVGAEVVRAIVEEAPEVEDEAPGVDVVAEEEAEEAEDVETAEVEVKVDGVLEGRTMLGVSTKVVKDSKVRATPVAGS